MYALEPVDRVLAGRNKYRAAVFRQRVEHHLQSAGVDGVDDPAARTSNVRKTATGLDVRREVEKREDGRVADRHVLPRELIMFADSNSGLNGNSCLSRFAKSAGATGNRTMRRRKSPRVAQTVSHPPPSISQPRRSALRLCASARVSQERKPRFSRPLRSRRSGAKEVEPVAMNSGTSLRDCACARQVSGSCSGVILCR